MVRVGQGGQRFAQRVGPFGLSPGGDGWVDGECVGGAAYSGRFDFTGQWRITPAPEPEPTMVGRFVILQGYNGFTGLHGVIEFLGRAGSDGWAEYSGSVHIDPS
jgi:hypothetical protein